MNHLDGKKHWERSSSKKGKMSCRGAGCIQEISGFWLREKCFCLTSPFIGLVLTVDFDVRHNHCQHLLVNINSRYLVRHICSLLAGAESVPDVTLNRVTGYRRSRRGETKMPNYSLNHARSRSDSLTASTSPLCVRPCRSNPLLY